MLKFKYFATLLYCLVSLLLVWLYFISFHTCRLNRCVSWHFCLNFLLLKNICWTFFLLCLLKLVCFVFTHGFCPTVFEPLPAKVGWLAQTFPCWPVFYFFYFLFFYFTRALNRTILRLETYLWANFREWERESFG